MRIGMVSKHPPLRGGVSSYTKNLVDFLRKNGEHIIVFSERSKQTEHDNHVGNVYECWNSGVSYPFQISKKLKSTVVDLAHIQHEFFLFGGLISATVFPLLLLFNKLFKIPTIVTMHGVLPLSELTVKFAVENEIKGPIWLLKLGIVLLTKFIVNLSNRIIVLNDVHRRILVNEYHCPNEKITVVPHGITLGHRIPIDQAKDILGFHDKKVILYFGYISKYKGIDLLVKAFEHVDVDNCILVLGAGMHPRLQSQQWYQEYVKSIKETSLLSAGRIRLVGFIPDDKLSLYLSASDVVVFPYTSSIATGGPFALAIGHASPVIASSVSSFSESLPSESVFAANSDEDLARTLHRILTQPSLRANLSKWANDLSEKNCWDEIAKLTEKAYVETLRGFWG